MTNWDKILTAAAKIARRLQQDEVNQSEAEKAGDYFSDHNYNEAAMRQYLQVLAEHPPVRSKRSAPHYRAIQKIWTDWQTDLVGQDKARAWGWAVRLAKISDGG